MTATIFSISPASRERVREAIQTILAGNERPRLERVRELAQVKQNHACALLRALREGMLSLDRPWTDEKPGPDEELAELIRKARTDTDRSRIEHELAAQVWCQKLAPSTAKAISDLLGEARQSDRASREANESRDDALPTLLCQPETLLLAKVVDRIVDLDIRERVYAFANEQAKLDFEQNPNPTPQEPA